LPPNRKRADHAVGPATRAAAEGAATFGQCRTEAALEVHTGICDRPGWPNAKNDRGELVRPPSLTAGKFNSPHGLAADRAGNLYAAEWLIGGRYTKLQRT
jgi:hypothetical protein